MRFEPLKRGLPSSKMGRKATKCMEYQLTGKELPYDFEELSKQSQAVRDQINELQENIAALPEEEAE